MTMHDNSLDWFEEDELDDLFNFAFPPPNAQSTFEGETPVEQELLLVGFLDACLTNRGLGRDDLADLLSTDVELIDAIFDSTLTADDLEGDLLADIAHALGYEPVILQLMLDYSKTPQTDLNVLVEKLVHFAVDGGATLAMNENGFKSQAEELDMIQTELANLLMQGFGGYYNAEIEHDPKQRILYEGVIKAVKAAIANYQADIEEARTMIQRVKDSYRAEIRSIQTMIEELRTVQAVEAIMKNDDLSRDLLRARIIEKLENM